MQRLYALLILAFALPVTAATPDLGKDAYRLPLVGPYAIDRCDLEFGISENSGMYQLVIESPLPSGSIMSTYMVTHVEQVAVHDRVIFGKSRDGFFILDTRQSDPQPQMFKSPDEWQSRLQAVGVTTPAALSNPDDLAAAVPDQILRPFNYRWMHHLFGMSDDLWSLVVQLLGFVIAFLIGLCWHWRTSPAVCAIVLGLIVNIVAEVILAGEGGPAFVGFFLFPLFCILLAKFAQFIRKFAVGTRPPPSQVAR